MKKKLFVPCLSALLAWMPSGSAATLTSVSNGSWETPSVWDAATIPTTADLADISNGNTVNIVDYDAISRQMRIGYGGNGVLRLFSGSLTTSNAGFFIGMEAGDVGTFRQRGGTVNVGRGTRIGGVYAGSTGAKGTFHHHNGVFNGNATTIGLYAKGTYNLSETGVYNAANFTIGDQPDSNGLVSVSGGELNISGTLWLGRHADSYGELRITGGDINVNGPLIFGESGVSRLKVTGSDGTLNVGGDITFNSQSIYNASVTEDGIMPISAGVDKSINLDGRLVPAFAVAFEDIPTSVVLFKTQGVGVINGEFNHVKWGTVSGVDLVYADQQVSLEKRIIEVSDEPLQQVTYGVDAERLWFWQSRWSTELAQLAVGDIDTSYVRVAINASYEREEGVLDPTAYTDQIIPMMNAMKTANPNVKFFASPRPLHESYTALERDTLWGGAVPWSPYPAWILQFVANGVDGDGNTRWIADSLDVEKLTQYLADYLNLMHTHGIQIDYMDMLNENGFVTAAHLSYVSANLEAKLNTGVPMPLLVAPSAWSLTGGRDWINSATTTFFDVAGVHNTGGDNSGNSMRGFVEAADAHSVPAWNTEMHGWIGPDIQTEIDSSYVLWEHLRAGFSMIETWLFFGDWAGNRAHAMVHCNWGNAPRSNAKYSIFKKLVNETTGGNFLDSTQPAGMTTASFIRGNTVTVWVLNNTGSAKTVDVFLKNQEITGSVEVSRWHAGLTNVNPEVIPDVSSLTPPSGSDFFSYTFATDSLYCLKITVN